MLKLKHFISVILLLAVQQVSAFQSNNLRVTGGEDFKVELSFEANDSFPGIWGDVPAGRVDISLSQVESDCDPGISKSKNIFQGLSFSVSKSNLKFFIADSAIFTRYSAVYIPIYLYTATFRL
jgi:hypothetical protein